MHKVFFSGEMEWVPMSTYKKIIDINVLGVIAGTKKFLPLIRNAKGHSNVDNCKTCVKQAFCNIMISRSRGVHVQHDGSHGPSHPRPLLHDKVRHRSNWRLPQEGDGAVWGQGKKIHQYMKICWMLNALNCHTTLFFHITHPLRTRCICCYFFKFRFSTFLDLHYRAWQLHRRDQHLWRLFHRPPGRTDVEPDDTGGQGRLWEGLLWKKKRHHVKVRVKPFFLRTAILWLCTKRHCFEVKVPSYRSCMNGHP